MSVNASKLVQIVSRVIDAGTPGLSFSGLFLTQDPLPPSGRVVQFPSAGALDIAVDGMTPDELAARLMLSGG